MAEYRTIHTKIWQDEWFCDLEPDGKLLFIYLFANPSASVSGIYEKPLKFIAFECGLPVERTRELLDAFCAAGKAEYEDGIVWVRHLRKYQETTSAPVQARIQKDIDAIPDSPIKRRYLACYAGDAAGNETVSIGSGDGIDSLSRADTDTVTDTDTETATEMVTETDTDTATRAPESAAAVPTSGWADPLREIDPIHDAYEQATGHPLTQPQQVAQLDKLAREYGETAVLAAISWCATRKAEDIANGKANGKDPLWFGIGYIASRLQHQGQAPARASPGEPRGKRGIAAARQQLAEQRSAKANSVRTEAERGKRDDGAGRAGETGRELAEKGHPT